MSRKIYEPRLSTVQDARAVRTREALRKAMLELLETTPIEQITIREIAATAGIGYITFFRHHPTKESLLTEVTTEQIHHLINMALPALETSDLRPASVALCQYVDDHRKLWSTLLTGGAAGTLREEFLKAAIELAAAWPHTRHWRPTKITVILIVSLTIELLAWWLRKTEPLSVEQIASIHERVIIKPAFKLHEEKQADDLFRSELSTQ